LRTLSGATAWPAFSRCVCYKLQSAPVATAKPSAKLRVRNHTPSDCSHWKWWASTEVVVAGSGSSKVVFVGSTLEVDQVVVVKSGTIQKSLDRPHGDFLHIAHRAQRNARKKHYFIHKHHAQRPDAKEKKKTACQTSIATHPRFHPWRYTETQVEIITTRPEGQAKKSFTLGQRGYRSSTRLENNLWLL
jgi:hypothetical protein